VTLARSFAIAAVLAGLGLAGCGGGGKSDTRQTTVSAAILAKANANCRYLRRETVKIGTGALSGNSNLFAMTTERLVKPSIPLLERVARRQQALAKQADDPKLTLYARLFEPAIALAKQRLRTGRISERPGHAQASILSKGLENLITDVGVEQKQVAGEAKLPACSIDFEHVLLSSLSG
jgi:hypothetical protein